jgi:hypothetical protein
MMEANKMSKLGLILGLTVSILLHGWLLLRPVTSAKAKEMPTKVAMVDVAKLPAPKEKAVVKQQQQKLQQKPVEKKQVKVEPPKVEAPKLVASNKQRVAKEQPKGDFAGNSNGNEEPLVRINWGDVHSAMALLKSSGMRLVVYESDGSVTQEVLPGSERFTLTTLAVKPSERYSDNIRIVDKVPAFAGIRTSLMLSSSRRLAVLVPVEIERMVETAKISEASRRGLSMKDIKVLGGRFDLAGGEVRFVIDKIQLRS